MGVKVFHHIASLAHIRQTSWSLQIFLIHWSFVICNFLRFFFICKKSHKMKSKVIIARAISQNYSEDESCRQHFFEECLVRWKTCLLSGPPSLLQVVDFSIKMKEIFTFIIHRLSFVSYKISLTPLSTCRSRKNQQTKKCDD